MNFNGEGWPIELEDKIVMDQNNSEHIKEAARVMSIYCDFIAVRAFPSLESKKDDLEDKVINGFNCLGTEVTNVKTNLLTNDDSQIVVARGITTNKPAIRSFFRSC